MKYALKTRSMLDYFNHMLLSSYLNIGRNFFPGYTSEAYWTRGRMDAFKKKLGEKPPFENLVSAVKKHVQNRFQKAGAVKEAYATVSSIWKATFLNRILVFLVTFAMPWIAVLVLPSADVAIQHRVSMQRSYLMEPTFASFNEGILVEEAVFRASLRSDFQKMYNASEDEINTGRIKATIDSALKGQVRWYVAAMMVDEYRVFLQGEHDNDVSKSNYMQVTRYFEQAMVRARAAGSTEGWITAPGSYDNIFNINSTPLAEGSWSVKGVTSTKKAGSSFVDNVTLPGTGDFYEREIAVTTPVDIGSSEFVMNILMPSAFDKHWIEIVAVDVNGQEGRVHRKERIRLLQEDDLGHGDKQNLGVWITIGTSPIEGQPNFDSSRITKFIIRINGDSSLPINRERITIANPRIEVNPSLDRGLNLGVIAPVGPVTSSAQPTIMFTAPAMPTMPTVTPASVSTTPAPGTTVATAAFSATPAGTFKGASVEAPQGDTQNIQGLRGGSVSPAADGVYNVPTNFSSTDANRQSGRVQFELTKPINVRTGARLVMEFVVPDEFVANKDNPGRIRLFVKGPGPAFKTYMAPAKNVYVAGQRLRAEFDVPKAVGTVTIVGAQFENSNDCSTPIQVGRVEVTKPSVTAPASGFIFGTNWRKPDFDMKPGSVTGNIQWVRSEFQRMKDTGYSIVRINIGKHNITQEHSPAELEALFEEAARAGLKVDLTVVDFVLVTGSEDRTWPGDTADFVKSVLTLKGADVVAAININEPEHIIRGSEGGAYDIFRVQEGRTKRDAASRKAVFDNLREVIAAAHRARPGISVAVGLNVSELALASDAIKAGADFIDLHGYVDGKNTGEYLNNLEKYLALLPVGVKWSMSEIPTNNPNIDVSKVIMRIRALGGFYAAPWDSVQRDGSAPKEDTKTWNKDQRKAQ
ncbi:MAG: hypothetical protein WC779_08480, partial [Candidatus Omnitrophota bacterium]